MALLIAAGIHEDCHREILGAAVAHSEDGSCWEDFHQIVVF
ncbi:MAG: hypothetical protein GYA29_02285 [Methanothrix sp.]|nr:hypothetical protein [Methanothrix sp.]